MRLRRIAGIVLVAVGIFILIRGWNYTSQRGVLTVGEFKASVEEKRGVPKWVGALLVAGGAVLIITDRRGSSVT